MNPAQRRAHDTRASERVVTVHLPHAIDPENFTPRLLTLLSNALVWRESAELRAKFGLGTNEFRVVSAIAIRPGVSATEISDFLGLNKAVVSKSVNVLLGRDLLVMSDGPRGSRPLYLTAEGAETHDAMLPISMRGQEIILEGLEPDVVTDLNRILRDMLVKLRAYPEAHVGPLDLDPHE
jgi:DNA-binding MarR family transcriptional regulator